MIISKDFKPKRAKDKRLPPGQYETKDFPLLSFGPTPQVSKDQWKLEVFGLDNNRSWNWEEFNKLPTFDE